MHNTPVHPAPAGHRSAPPKTLYYVLSAGRTGTLFLENLIERHCPGVTVEHEPSPSRYLMMLGNMRNDWAVLAGATRRFARYHQEKHHGRPGKYIEINPFLCPVTDLLAESHAPIRIVHMLRSPGAWAQSMTTFKASTRYRHIIDYVPFAKPYPAPRPEGWNRLSAFEKGLYRWNWCNTRIAALESVAQGYTRIRSEDLFSGDQDVSRAALARIFATLELPFPEQIAAEEFRQRVNPAPKGGDMRDPQMERAICGPTAAVFGYDL